MKPENRDLFPEIILFPAMEKVKRIALGVAHVARRLIGYMPEEPLIPPATHFDHPEHPAGSNIIRFPHGSEGDYYDDAS